MWCGGGFLCCIYMKEWVNEYSINSPAGIGFVLERTEKTKYLFVICSSKQYESNVKAKGAHSNINININIIQQNNTGEVVGWFAILHSKLLLCVYHVLTSYLFFILKLK